MAGYVRDDITADELERERALYAPFTDAIRDLVDAGIRTTVDPEEIQRAQAEIEAITARLRTRQIPGAYGVRFGATGRGRPWGNPVVGLRNAAAPPLVIERAPEQGRVWSEFHLGAAYEGPPTLVHGGVVAELLDQLLGEAAGAGGKPGMTAQLSLSYRLPTPLGDLRAEAWIERSEGIKTWTRAQMIGPDGVTVEAEALMILPRWAREAVERDGAAHPMRPTPQYFE